MIRVLFVCSGNICRSPTAEGVFAKLLAERGYDSLIVVDSAGTGAWHIGEAPDERSQATARRFGVDLSRQRARRVAPNDFESFDYVVAMDSENLAGLRQRCPKSFESRLRLMCEFAPAAGVRDVPDPYYGGDDGFEQVFRLVQDACEGLLDLIESNHLQDLRQ